jgi:hypothetical protein
MNAENPCIHFTESPNNIAGAFRHFLQKETQEQEPLGQ